MKILLKDVRKKLYFRHGRVWTSNPEAAFEFGDSQELFQFVEAHALHEVQAVLMFENPRRCEAVPLELTPSGVQAARAA